MDTEVGSVISFSGGRSSAFMLHMLLDEHGGLPDNSEVIFTNTGKEMPQTLDFVRDCEKQWQVPITWLEYRKGYKYEQVTYDNASRNGEPFADLIDDRSFLPNSVMRFCTSELKIKTIERYFGKNHTKYIGIRADEPRRVSRIRAKGDDSIMPLADAGITKQDINAFWANHSFDLNLPNASVNTLSNCDLCFLKGAAIRKSIIEFQPELADWWIEQENKLDSRFSKDSPSYNQLKIIASDQMQLFDYEIAACFCGD